eukprot:TRINITY_DN4703_c0_g1_i2.p1 TRINITY_DN4703_c0_g1~~TRINITY_DN4703_c0_g1_i2.p1  ORF type:complete len:456 (+),score=74.79 TRINITY_DN4703_c0_g1_i2:36-1403(+)
METVYKEEHENFLSGLKGGPVEEIIYVLLLIPVSILFHRVIITILFKDQSRFTFTRIFVDFASAIIPLFLGLTILTEHLLVLILTLLSLSIIIQFVYRSLKGGVILTINDSQQLSSLSVEKKPFIDEYRSYMLATTFIAILAVDFTIFPRRFAKTETYGISLMDVGVGAFLFAQAMTSKQARNSVKKASRIQLLLSTIKSTIPLLIFGFVRLLSVKGTNYQEHASEYGVHWNFFFSMASVAVFLAVLDVPIHLNGIFGALILFGYQYTLSTMGLADFIIHSPREGSLFTQNREGIFSTIGNGALFLFAAQIGNFILRPRKNINEWRMVAFQFFLMDVAFWVMTAISHLYVEPVSRRMVNMSYVLLITSMSVMVLTTSLIVALITKPIENSVLVALNRNGLALFLLANICTGLVNLSIQTIHCNNLKAFLILFGYISFICGVALFLWKKKISLKFW